MGADRTDLPKHFCSNGAQRWAEGLHARLCLGPAAEANQCADRDIWALGAELLDITLATATQPAHRELPAVTLLLDSLLEWHLYFTKFPSPFFQSGLTVRRG